MFSPIRPIVPPSRVCPRRGYTIGDGWGCIPPPPAVPKKIAALQPVCRSLVVSNAISQINAFDNTTIVGEDTEFKI